MVVEIIKAIIFGIVEGITEWLPILEYVSSGYTIWSNISSSSFIF